MSSLVMKFGGASVARPKDFLNIAQIIIDKTKEYEKIVVVVSAMGKTTNKLLALAKKINDQPSKREQDMLISVGERISMSLLSMALQKKNMKSISFTGSQCGIITCSNHSNAKIIDVKPYRITEALKAKNIVIVAGFQGVSREKEITTLGRGGSDISAVAIAVALKCEMVEFYKDVEGIYNEDPKIKQNSKFFHKLTYEEALSIIEKNTHFILHPRCIKLAFKNNIKLIIKSFKKKKILQLLEKKTFKKVGKIVYEIN